MTRKNNRKIISVGHPIYCRFDVHKDMISACIIITGADGQETFNASKILYKIFS